MTYIRFIAYILPKNKNRENGQRKKMTVSYIIFFIHIIKNLL